MINQPNEAAPQFVHMDKGLGERIALVRKQLAMSQKAFGRCIGIGIAKMNRIERGHVAPDAELLLAIRNKFDCDIAWLLTGHESSEQALLLKDSLPLMKVKNVSAEEGRILIPGIPNGCFAVRLNSEEMSPTIRSGDIVIVRPQQNDIEEGAIVLYECPWGEVRARRYRMDHIPKLYAEDHGLPPLPINDDYRVVGVAVQVTRQVSL